MKYVKKIGVIIIIPLVLFLMFSILAPGFGFNSLSVILSQSMIPLIIGFGMAFCLTGGLFDLSAGCQIVVAGVIGGYLSRVIGPAGLIIGCIVSGLVTGTLMGAVYRVTKIPSMVVSIGMIMVIEVLAKFMVGINSVMKITQEVADIANGTNAYIYAIIASVIFFLIYYKTRFATHLKALGCDEIVAKNMGVKTETVKMQSFIVAGLFFGIAAILQISYSAAMSVQLDTLTISMAFKPIMGVLIGLQLLTVLDNMVIGIFVGEFAISMIFTGLIAMGLPATTQNIFLGLFLVIVVAVSENSKRIRDMARRKKVRKDYEKTIKQAQSD